MIRIAVIDDHELIRHGLEYLLHRHEDLQVVLRGSSVGDLRGFDAGYDVLILDLYLAEDRPCLAAVKELAAVTRVLIVSASGRPADVLAAIRCGANGYVTKDAPSELIVAAVRTVAAGGFYLSAGLADILQSELDDSARPPAGSGAQEEGEGGEAPPRLSAREEETLSYIAQGFTHAQVGRRMGLSKATVDTYVERIRAKLQVGNKAELTRAALNRLERRDRP
ncbi:LuxR C-terminal-related transcriptional regulator [Nonomuraea sp. NPDC049684]|uniref:LuxR C-terminal-related transcriptional regulator n=1 Tax=unclassified Nonomuraea TaxID=2593643 RepID=UPI00378EBB88